MFLTQNIDIKEVNINKIKAIFLNKVENLPWYYFDLDLNASDSPRIVNPDEFLVFLDDIDINSLTGRCKYINTQNPVTAEDVFRMLISFLKKNPEIIGVVTKRIFDINEKEILNKSDSAEGFIGKYNEKERIFRNNIYKKRIKKFTRSDNHFVIMAEGDSWLQFPKIYFGRRWMGVDFVKDVLDWLIEDPHYAVYNLSAGGDWLSNMMYMGEYIEDLPKVSPDVFLISGGGNDLVGNHRLATMAINPHLHGPRNLLTPHIARLINKREGNPIDNFDFDKYKLGLSLITDDFYNFLNVCMTQYFLYFFNINSSAEYRNMIFITQGYDHAKPSGTRNGGWFSLQRIENKFINSGKWLFEALQMKGISDPAEQEAMVYACITEFNEMLISLAHYFHNVFHIDCRGVAEKFGWYDELHLTSAGYKSVAEAYKLCIQQNARHKLYETKKSKVYKPVLLDKKR